MEFVALVTGGASGIGRATGARFHEAGANVLSADLGAQSPEAGIEAVALDVTDASARRATIDGIRDNPTRHGKPGSCTRRTRRGGLASPEESAAAIFLASDASCAITGTVFISTADSPPAEPDFNDRSQP